MIGPELTVLGVAEAELPVSSETTMLLYVMDIRYRVCPGGQAKLPGLSGPTEIEEVTWPWLTGKFPELTNGPASRCCRLWGACRRCSSTDIRRWHRR
jgi:hypothetical protein